MNIETALQRADEWTDGQTFHERSEGWRPAVAVLAEEVRRLRRDEARLDWLADLDNTIGNVQLPFKCVEANVSSMRGAIDAAMALDKEAVK